MQQLWVSVQTSLVHLVPFLQLVQVPCLAFTLLAFTGALANTAVAANRIANRLMVIFFMIFKLMLNNRTHFRVQVCGIIQQALGGFQLSAT